MSNYYNNNYFTSQIFDYDYDAIADAIIHQYHPGSVIEFGCGNGNLSKALAAKGIIVEAVDGYATPDFTGHEGIRFTKLDLNNDATVKSFLSGLNKKFDIALSFEVAEHLNPESSAPLIGWMTSMADVVIFSSAVLEQAGDGHINCRSREFWHHLFEENQFMIADTIREKIRNNKKVARWYRHNIIDYCRLKNPYTSVDYNKLITRLVASDSAASSDYYLAYRKMEYRDQILNMQPIRFVFQLRNRIKKMLGKKPIVIE